MTKKKIKLGEKLNREKWNRGVVKMNRRIEDFLFWGLQVNPLSKKRLIQKNKKN